MQINGLEENGLIILILYNLDIVNDICVFNKAFNKRAVGNDVLSIFTSAFDIGTNIIHFFY